MVARRAVADIMYSPFSHVLCRFEYDLLRVRGSASRRLLRACEKVGRPNGSGSNPSGSTCPRRRLPPRRRAKNR